MPEQKILDGDKNLSCLYIESILADVTEKVYCDKLHNNKPESSGKSKLTITQFCQDSVLRQLRWEGAPMYYLKNRLVFI